MSIASHGFPSAVYLLCFLTSATCAWLLLRSFFAVRSGMLLWSACCFVLLALNNLIVVFDLLIVPGMDLRTYRLVTALAGVGVLLYGFIWRGDEM